VGIGLGLILLALELIVQAVHPITQANGVQVIFASLTGDIMLDALIGAMFAIISYSSLAAVLLTATLTSTGVISFPVALCLVIGANLGSGILAMINNSAANASARRVALGSLLFKLVGSLIILPFVHVLADAPYAAAGIGTGYLLPRLLQPDSLRGDGALCRAHGQTLQTDDS
jgi:phosphate:Na+ symporter